MLCPSQPAQDGLESSWIVMAHGNALEGKWRGNWRMEWVDSTLHTTSELPVMRTPRLPVVDWTDAPADLNGLVRFAEIWFLRVCHHISNAVYHVRCIRHRDPRRFAILRSAEWQFLTDVSGTDYRSHFQRSRAFDPWRWNQTFLTSFTKARYMFLS